MWGSGVREGLGFSWGFASDGRGGLRAPPGLLAGGRRRLTGGAQLSVAGRGS
jgi:hypothetical protein